MPDSPPTTDRVEGTLLAAIRRVAPVDMADAELLASDLREDLLLDSLALVIVLTDVEEALSIDLSALGERLTEAATVGDLATLVRTLSP